MRRLYLMFAVIVPYFSLLILSCSHYRGLVVNSTKGIFTLAQDPHGMILKAPDGLTVLRYMTKKPAKTHFAANSTCCFHPLYTPSGVRLTDLAPGDHHRGVFLA